MELLPGHRVRILVSGWEIRCGKVIQKRGLGATLATISSYSTGAHALYHSMGFTKFDLLEPWIKEWS
ncbi:MAG TPA: hypothetical protein VFY25_06860 [Anaerolineales bacterium]|nr:hypothetical protein [Anaerolineales bacterium]